MKETNSVPAWEEEAKPDEVLVQTSTGLFKFQGNCDLPDKFEFDKRGDLHDPETIHE